MVTFDLQGSVSMWWVAIPSYQYSYNATLVSTDV